MNARWKIPPCIRPLDTGYFTLCADAILCVDGEEFTIPAGFVFDGASVPPFVRIFIRPFLGSSLTLKAACAHDFFYRRGTTAKLSRKQADEVYAALLRQIDIRLYGRWTNLVVNAKIRFWGIPAHFWGVRAGGWASWKKRD